MPCLKKKSGTVLFLPCMPSWHAQGQIYLFFTNSALERTWRSLAFIGPCILIYFYTKPTRFINVSNLFYGSNTVHVSDGFSVHHQELKTAYTATDICQTGTANCLLASRQQYLSDICLLQYVQSLTPDDGRKGHPKHVECYSNKIKLRHWCFWLVLL